MPTISAGDLALLRGENHRSTFYLSVCPATTLWQARLNGTLSRGEVTIPFDAGSGVNFSQVGELQEIWIGSSSGDNDRGRVRIKSITSGDSGVTGSVTLANNSILWADDDFLTFIGWYLPKPKRPFINGSGTFFKDGNIAYTNQNTQPAPVCIAGENRADIIDEGLGYFEINSQLPSSYTIADGATITSYNVAVAVGNIGNVTIALNTGTGVGTVRFTDSGVFWLKWSTTDSNGVTQDTYRWYSVHNSDDPPVTTFAVNNLSGDWNNGGWQSGIQLFDNATLDDIPDHCPVILWAISSYGETQKNITFLPDESTTLINGYVKRDQFNQDLSTGSPSGSFEIVTIQEMLNIEYNFSVSLEVSQTVDAWWKYPVWLTPNRGLHHLYLWHSTLLEIADVIGLMDNVDPIAYIEFQDSSLLSMGQSFIRDRSVRANIISDNGGRVHVTENIQLLPDAERSGLTIVQSLTNPDKSGEVTYVREQTNNSPFVHTSGFQFTGTFDGEGKPIANPLCAIAPGQDVLEFGESPVSFGRQTFTGQTHANQIAGRILASSNNEFPEIRFNFSGNYLGVLQPHLREFWDSTLNISDTIREMFRSFNLVLRNVSASINVTQGTILVSTSFEAEAIGDIGQFTNCPTFPDLPGTDYEIPDEEDLPGALITGASVNRKPPQSKIWTQINTDQVSHMYRDPFDTSSVSNEAILIRSGVGYISRSTDGGLTWSSITPSTDPPNDAGDGIAPTRLVVDYAQGDGSFTTQDEHCFIARWQNAGDEWRSWLLYTDDNGTTYTWQSMGGSGTSFNIVTSSEGINNNPAQSQTILQLNSSEIVVVSEAGTRYKIDLIDITTGTTTDSEEATDADVRIMAVCRLTDSRFAVVSDENDLGFLICRVFDVVADVIVEKAQQKIHNNFGTNAVCIERVSNTKFLVAYDINIAGTAQGTLIVGTYDGISAISYGTETLFTAETVTSMSMRYMRTTTNEVYHLYYAYSTGTPLLAGVTIDLVSGGATIIVGGAQSITTGTIDHVSMHRLDDTKSIIAFTGSVTSDGFCIAVNLSSGSHTKGSIVEFKDTTTILATYISGNIIAYRNSPEDLEYIDYSVSGLTITLGSMVEFPADGTYPAVLKNNSIFALVYKDPTTTPTYKTTVDATANNAIKALGLSISKGIGDTLYITYWDGSQLACDVYDFPALTLIRSFTLGSTPDNVDFTVYPLSPFGDDDFCWFYGRMNDPSTLGIVHIIYTDDFGVTLFSFENRFGSSICESLIDDFDTVYATRNSSGQSKLYGGTFDDGLSVISTIPFPASTKRFGIFYEWFSDSMFAGANVGNTIMVMQSEYPFLVWGDVTFNHATSSGIEVIIAL